MDGAQLATILVALMTAVIGPLALHKLQRSSDERKQARTSAVEDRAGERQLLQDQLKTLLDEQNRLRETLRNEIHERDELINARDTRIGHLEERISIVEQTLLDYQAGRISPAGYVLVPVAYVLAWRRGEQVRVPPEPFVGEPALPIIVDPAQLMRGDHG